MAKNAQNTNPKASPKATAKNVANKALPAMQKNLTLFLATIVALMGILLYANTIHHKYVLDDYPTIKENKLTKKGIHGIPEIFKHSYWYGNDGKDDWLYRPLSVAMFALEWEFWPDQPSAGHTINILLYGLTGFALFYTLCKVFENKSILFPFAISLLFMAHPLHTEVVANIKSRDEILTFLFFLLSFSWLLDYARKDTTWKLAGATTALFLALMAKESAIMFLFIFPVGLFFYTPMPIKKILITTAILALAAGLYMFLRGRVLSTQTLGQVVSIVDNTVVKSDLNHRLGTALVIIGVYIKLLFIPSPLVYDYSFNTFDIVSLSDPYALLSLLIYLGIGAYIVFNLIQLKKDTIAFSLLLYVLPVLLVSNIFFLTRSTAAERFLYQPLLGFAIIIVLLLAKFTKTNLDQANFHNLKTLFSKNIKFWSILAVVLALYSFKTTDRAMEWKDNMTLFKTDLQNIPRSARAQYSYANDLCQMLVKESIKTKAEREEAYKVSFQGLNNALAIHNDYFEPNFSLGQLAAYKKDYNASNAYYRRAMQLNKDDHFLYNNIGNNYFRMNKMDSARLYISQALKMQADYAEALSNMGSVYFTLGVNEANHMPWLKDSAVVLYQKAIAADPKYYDAYKNLGSTYGMMKQYNLAMEFFFKAMKIKSTDPDLYNFIGITYDFLGDPNNGKLYKDKSAALRAAQAG